MSEDLKPCPFCGGEAQIERVGDRRQSTIYSCLDCGCCLETGENHNQIPDRWNERTDVDAVVPHHDTDKDAEIKRLRSEIRQIRQIAEDSSEAAKYRLDSIIDNAAWALDPRSSSPIPDPAGGMPVEVETDDRAEDYVKHGLREEDLP